MSLLLILAIITTICSLYTLHYLTTKGKSSMELNKEKLIEDLTKALAETENEETSLSFVSEKDESAFFPEEVEGWELIGRASRRIPAHFANDARYRRKNAGIIQIEKATGE